MILKNGCPDNVFSMPMKTITLYQIETFLNCKTIAIAGASRNAKSFSAQVAVHLKKLGYSLFLINPNFEQTEQKLISISNLPEGINNLLIITPKNQTESVLKQAIDKGIKNIWIQQTSDTPEAITLGLENNINLIYRQCIFMFTQPTGIHKFHYGLKKFFGSVPK
jgi:predicted CoA-binding protein